MNTLKQIIGLVAFFVTLITVPSTGEVAMAIGPLAIAGIGAGLKVGGAIFGGLRRRRRRRQLERRLGRAAEIRADAIDRTRQGVVQGQLASRERAEEAQEQQLEQLQLQALRQSGGAQSGLDPAALEAVIRANAGANAQIDAQIADRITQAAQRAELAKADVLAGLEEQKAGLRAESGEQADRAIGGVLESIGGSLSLVPGLGGGGGASALSSSTGNIGNIGDRISRFRFVRSSL